MGAIFFSLDVELVKSLRRQLSLPIMVETGTYKGDTAAGVARLFEKIYTVELSAVMFASAKQRLAGLPNVACINGSSPDAIKLLRPELSKASVLYWLDAHWCGGATAGTDQECPLMDELAAIARLNDESVVLIDDARFFICPPPAPHKLQHWPNLTTIIDGLRALSDSHCFWVINDVMIFAPKRSEPDVVEYGRTRGIDLQKVYQAAAGKS